MMERDGSFAVYRVRDTQENGDGSTSLLLNGLLEMQMEIRNQCCMRQSLETKSILPS